MRSLFLKLFLWFGLAMVLINVASFATGIFTERRFQPQRNHPVATTMAVFAESAVNVFERDGAPALDKYLNGIQQVSSINAVLVDAGGHDLSSRPVPDNGQEILQRLSPQNTFVFEPPRPGQAQPHHGLIAGQMITSKSGNSYTLVAVLPQGLPGPPPRIGEAGSLGFGMRVLARTLLPLLLIGGLFCYALAKYLAKPIVELRSTTQELSDGNLGARVEQGLTNRRDEIGHLSRDFNLMAGHIESLVNAHKRLLTDISHELRSPLARQVVALGLARRNGNPEVTPALDRIGRETGRMNDMIGQLLDLSRVENKTESLQTTRINLASLVNEIAEDADFEARDRMSGVTVHANGEVAINGVYDLLRSAIENIVRNGVRHTPEGSQVTIDLESVDHSALIKVRDHGRGVPENALEDIFRPFYRVEEARDRKSGGTGLGLAIAARAVRLHGGTISARNATDGGLIVEVRLPLNNFDESLVNETV